MILILGNTTGSTQTYLSGAISVAANGTTTITSIPQQTQLATDGTLRGNIFSGAATVGDGVNTLAAQDAINYLYQLIQANPKADISTSGTIAASGTGSAIVASFSGCNNLNISITGTWVGTLQFQYQVGDGTWYSPGLSPNSGGQLISSTTVNGLFSIDVGGFTQFRVYFSAYTSGTASIQITTSVGDDQTLATDVNGNQQVVGNIAAGTTDSGNGVKVSGVFNTTVPAYTNGQRGDIQLDARGAQQTTPLDGSRATYSAGKLGLVPQGSDSFTITGSATKTIRVTRIEVSFTQSIYNENEVQLIKRSTANTGGSSTSIAAVPHDSNSAAATATVLAYTANPTLGTEVGVIRTAKVFGQATSEPYAASTILVWDFGSRPSQAIVLRGTSQVLAINLNSVTISGISMDISIEWTEE